MGSQKAVKTIVSVYFEYQGKVPPNEYHYLVEVSKKDADGLSRSPEQLRIVASIMLLNSLSVAPEGVLTPVTIEKSRFDEIAKEEIFRGTDGAIYGVIQEQPSDHIVPNRVQMPGPALIAVAVMLRWLSVRGLSVGNITGQFRRYNGGDHPGLR